MLQAHLHTQRHAFNVFANADRQTAKRIYGVCMNVSAWAITACFYMHMCGCVCVCSCVLVGVLYTQRTASARLHS